MQHWPRRVLRVGGVLTLTGALLAGGQLLVAAPDPGPTAAPSVTQVATLTDSITGLQRELERLPANDAAWAQLGAAYVEQARRTADPTFYDRAEGAFADSLRLRPEDNDAALTGQASLAAARHDFAGALQLAERALEINSYSATAYATKTDALVELGRYEQARAALEQMLQLRPGLDAFTRASYALELQGDVTGARRALERALEGAPSPAGRAFAHYYLGELAWNSGDLATARGAYEAALTADPGFVAALTGRAKVLAATGDVTAALDDYRAAVGRQPQPEFLVQFGELLEASGQSQAAEEQYEVVRAIQQLFAAAGQDVDTEVAVFEADHGDPAAAVASAERAYRARPDAIFTQDAYAWALHAAGRSKEALPLARQAVRTGLRLPVLHYHLGVIEAAVGETTAAVTSLSTALELNPAFSPLHAPQAQSLLASLR